MQVRNILSRKGSSVATIGRHDTVKDVIDSLEAHGIGALVVIEADQIIGIISERDVVRGLTAHGPGLLGHPVAEVMTREVMTCTPRDSIDHLMATMTERRIRHLPVLSEGRLAGIVSIGDIVKYRVDELELENNRMHEYITTGR
ncbi:MAG: Inosine-5'-monophosphate dehydrogenase [Acidimicrobiales bacterium]|nr:MAG: CBS domain-containing protein [Actinomycetota bacterium]MBV6508606.1 Inosine-5'-monophosphate dehydrogenase [Acidimicrobiales bacterium]RIK08063.1 MAG: histidine kinase [Acidobacteriota bacterium]